MVEKQKGKLTIFTSYTPGAGKSYYMARQAVIAAEHGKKVVVGFLNADHRDISQILYDNGLKKLFRKKYSLKKIISLHPDLVIMDEMGMSGYNKDRKSFIYEDILTLLNCGTDVYTSANLKRFDSINPKFREITGIRIRKTIPDIFLDMADKIYFVDREPEKMIEDFRNGKIFTGKQAASSIMKKNFDRKNLEAYRELSLDILKQNYEKQLEIYERTNE